MKSSRERITTRTGTVIHTFPKDILTTMLGHEYDFYGVDDTTFCIGTGDVRLFLEAVEDDSVDEYRSFFDKFAIVEPRGVFFRESIARVVLKAGGVSTRSTSGSEHDFSGWVLVDSTTGHTWLTIGTDYGEDYYPCFTFRYTPDTNVHVEVSQEG